MLSDLLELMEDKGVKKAIWTCLTGRACTSHTALLLAWIVWSCWTFDAEKESCLVPGPSDSVAYEPTVERGAQLLLRPSSRGRNCSDVWTWTSVLQAPWSCFFFESETKTVIKVLPFASFRRVASNCLVFHTWIRLKIKNFEGQKLSQHKDADSWRFALLGCTWKMKARSFRVSRSSMCCVTWALCYMGYTWPACSLWVIPNTGRY